MLEQIINVSNTNAYLFEKAVSDIPEHLLCDQSKGFPNHPLWLLGHVALARSAAVRSLGGEFDFPESWAKLFGRGSEPVSDPSAYPTRAELLAKYKQAATAFAQLAPRATPEMLSAPHAIVPLQGVFKTVGDLVSGITTLHDALHLGQLTAWRRLMGMPSLMG